MQCIIIWILEKEIKQWLSENVENYPNLLIIEILSKFIGSKINLKYQLGPKIRDFSRAAVMFTIENNGEQILEKYIFFETVYKIPIVWQRNVYRVQCTLCLYTLFSKNAFNPEFKDIYHLPDSAHQSMYRKLSNKTTF